jgi:hypothetical protein
VKENRDLRSEIRLQANLDAWQSDLQKKGKKQFSCLSWF